MPLEFQAETLLAACKRHRVKTLLVSEGIHRLPKAVMEEGLHFPFCRETLDGSTLKRGGFIRNLADHRWRKDEETSVDPPAFTFRLLLEGRYPASLQDQAAKTRYGMYCGDRDLFTVASVECDFGRDIHVG